MGKIDGILLVKFFLQLFPAEEIRSSYKVSDFPVKLFLQ